MLFLLLAAFFAGWLYSRSAPVGTRETRAFTEETLRASMRQLIRQELSGEIQRALDIARSGSTNALAALEARLTASSQAERRELLQALATILNQMRKEEKASTLAMFERLEERHAKGLLDLRRDLEGLASATDDEIRQVRARWASLLAQASPSK
jgi:hypothetical protein